MKAVLISILISLSGLIYSQSYNYIEADTRLNKEFTPTLTLYGEMPFNDRFGYTNYIYVTQGWAEFLPGIYYKPWTSLLIAGYAGLETEVSSVRFGANLSYTGGRIRGSVFAEKGEGELNYWYDAQVWWNIKFHHLTAYYLVPRTRYGYGTGIGVSVKRTDILSTIDGYVTVIPFYDIDQNWRPTLFLTLEY